MRRRTTAGIVLPGLLLGLMLGGCAAQAPPAPDLGLHPTTSTPVPAGSSAAPVPTPSPHQAPASTAAPAPAATRAAPPPFHASVETVTAADLPHTWHEGCPVGPEQLRRIRMTYWGFDGAAHTGVLIVAADVVPVAVTGFHRLYDARFPIRRMVPVDVYGGSDDASVAADNTAGFNCRTAYASGPPHWSEHAYGTAIDIDPFENPYVEGSKVTPPGAQAYADRSRIRPGMITPGSLALRAFTDQGWGWGGLWNTPDYQHVSRSGH